MMRTRASQLLLRQWWRWRRHGRDPRRWFRAARFAVSRFGGSGDYQPFVIVTRSRSGSNLLVSMLDGHPQTHVEGELLGRVWGGSVDGILDRLFRSYPSFVTAVGFKYFYYHPVDGDPEQAWRALERREGLRFIHLTRRNLLRIEVSRRLAASTGTWSQRRPASTRFKEPVHLTAPDLERRFEVTRRHEAMARARFGRKPWFELSYEDLIADPAGRASDVQRFLGLDVQSVRSPLVRQNPEPLSALIANYEALAADFRDTRWASFFEE